MRSGLRWFLLCEDRNQERFFVKLGRKLLGSVPTKVIKPPEGEGAASQWVLGQYPAHVRRYPRRYPDENVALVAVVDGDNEGWERRKRRFDEGLSDNRMSARLANERVAICVPTWSIETWLAALCEWQPPHGLLSEGKTIKREVERAIKENAVAFDRAVEAWVTFAPRDLALPSLVDGSREMGRAAIGLK